MSYKILVSYGTRPEFIKLAPLIIELKKNKFEVITCNTGQHKEMINPLFDFFNLNPDYNFDVMKDQQSLSSLTSKIMNKFDNLLFK